MPILSIRADELSLWVPHERFWESLLTEGQVAVMSLLYRSPHGLGSVKLGVEVTVRIS